MEMQTSTGDAKCMSPQVYATVVREINEIRGLFVKRSNNNQDADPCSQLIEIETYINKIIKFVNLSKMACPEDVNKIMKALKSEEMETKRKAMEILKMQEKEEQARKLQERKDKKTYVAGIRRNFQRSQKPTQRRH